MFFQAFWREKGLSGEVVTNGGPSVVPGMETGPLCVVFDATSCHGNPAIVGFIGGKQQRQYNKLTVSENNKEGCCKKNISECLESLAEICVEFSVDRLFLGSNEFDGDSFLLGHNNPFCALVCIGILSCYTLRS